MDKGKERNDFTGTTQDKPSGRILNPMTGQYRESSDDSDDVVLTKGNDPLWPSISERDDDEIEDDSVEDSEPVRKEHSDSQWPSLLQHLCDDNVSKGNGDFEMHVPIFAVEKKGDKDEHIVCAIVYQPDTVDAQGDQASAEEIEKAAHDFMENSQTFKVMHKGKPAKVKILESYIAPQDIKIAKQAIKKGTWLMTVRVNDDKIWKDVKSGKLTGFSMAGYAKVG